MRLRDRRVEATFPVRLTCQITGFPEPTLKWYRDDFEIKEDGNVLSSLVSAASFVLFQQRVLR